MKTRREFLKTAGIAAASTLSAPAIISAKPNSKISVACIGVRGRGNSVMHTFAGQSDCAITHI